MSTTTTVRNQARPGWDKRAWKLSFLLSLIMGALVLTGIIPPIAHRLHIPDDGSFAAASAILSMFIFPPILAGVAKRRWLLWAYLPFFVFFLWLFAAAFLCSVMGWSAEISSSGPVGPREIREMIIGFVVLFLCPLITAGPVCLFRLLRRRAVNQRIAGSIAMEQAIQTTREGVWPPPPSSGSSV